MFVSGGKDKVVCLWDTRNEKTPAARLEEHEGPVMDVKIHANRIMSASGDKTAKLWDLRFPRNSMITLYGHSDGVHSCDFNDEFCATGSVDTSLRIGVMNDHP